MKNILIVDDSEDTQEFLQIIFSNKPELSIDYASTSKEAIEFFNKHAYNACVLDVSLPDLTGYYLGNLIRKSCPEMPIAFLTNYDSDLTKENAQFIDAKFWSKSEFFQSPEQLAIAISNLATDHACGNKGDIEIPEILRHIS